MEGSSWKLLALILVLFRASDVQGGSCGVPDTPTCEGGQLFKGGCGTFQKKTSCWGTRKVANTTEGAPKGSLILDGEFCCVQSSGLQKECCQADSDTIALLAAGMFVLIIGVMIGFCCCPCCPWNHVLKAEIEASGIEELDDMARQTFRAFILRAVADTIRCCRRAKRELGVEGEYEDEEEEGKSERTDATSSRI